LQNGHKIFKDLSEGLAKWPQKYSGIYQKTLQNGHRVTDEEASRQVAVQELGVERDGCVLAVQAEDALVAELQEMLSYFLRLPGQGTKPSTFGLSFIFSSLFC
jgi:hypothetical protein